MFLLSLRAFVELYVYVVVFVVFCVLDVCVVVCLLCFVLSLRTSSMDPRGVAADNTNVSYII